MLGVLAWQFTRTRLLRISQLAQFSYHYHLTQRISASSQMVWETHMWHESSVGTPMSHWLPFTPVCWQCKSKLKTSLLCTSSVHVWDSNLWLWQQPQQDDAIGLHRRLTLSYENRKTGGYRRPRKMSSVCILSAVTEAGHHTHVQNWLCN